LIRKLLHHIKLAIYLVTDCPVFCYYYYYRMLSNLRNSRYRRDPRQPAEEEEMWFNEEDDFEDVPTSDLENNISKCCLTHNFKYNRCIYLFDCHVK
jgi:hypothetical protein